MPGPSSAAVGLGGGVSHADRRLAVRAPAGEATDAAVLQFAAARVDVRDREAEAVDIAARRGNVATSRACRC